MLLSRPASVVSVLAHGGYRTAVHAVGIVGTTVDKNALFLFLGPTFTRAVVSVRECLAALMSSQEADSTQSRVFVSCW